MNIDPNAQKCAYLPKCRHSEIVRGLSDLRDLNTPDVAALNLQVCGLSNLSNLNMPSVATLKLQACLWLV